MRTADNLPPSCAIFTNSGNLNFLEPSGPGTGLLYLYSIMKIHPVGGKLFHAYDRQTDMSKLIVAFHNFVDAPETVKCPYTHHKHLAALILGT